MNAFLASVLADPKGWAAALALIGGGAIGWLWRQYSKLRDRVGKCEEDRAVLHEKLATANEHLAVERGRVDVLVVLLKKEVHLG